MDYTAEATVYAGTRRDAEEYAATCNARHGLPMSNEDKRAAARRLLEIHPEWSNREIARRLGVSHPFVGKVRRALEAEAEASGNDYQMPEERVVTRGDQTYTYRPPEQVDDTAPESEGVAVPPETVPEAASQSPSDPSTPASFDEPSQSTPQPTQTPASPDEPPRLAEVIRERLIEGDVEGFVEALRQDRLDGISKPKTPSGLYNALNVIFRHSETYGIDPWDRDRAVRCLYDAIVGTGKEDSAPEKAQDTDAATCPECGGRVIHISANGKPARDVCMECGAVIEIEEETV
jgi:DNA-directed RNA polymerase subunit RPC12/RpoP